MAEERPRPEPKQWSWPRYNGWVFVLLLAAAVVWGVMAADYLQFNDENYGNESVFCHSPDLEPRFAEPVDCADSVLGVVFLAPPLILIGAAGFAAWRRTLTPFRIGLGLLVPIAVLSVVAFN